MKKLIVIVLLAAAVAAYLTNPKPDQHREVAKQRINQLMQESMSEAHPLLGSIGAAVGKTLLSPMLDNIVNSNNYYLFSTTTLTWNGVKHVVGTGAFGRVFLGEKFDQVYKSMANDEKAEE